MNRILIKKIIQYIFKLLNILLIWLTIVLALISIFKKEWIITFIEWLEKLIHWLGNFNYFIAWISSFIEWLPVLWLVVPWQNILLIVWWFFWNINSMNLIFVMYIASIWAIIWNFVWYKLWEIYWDSFFKKYWYWFWIWLTEVKYLKKWIHKWWALWIIIWKFHPVSRAFLPFIAWSMGMNSRKFMIYNIIGSIVRAIVIISLWVLFVEYYKIILEYIWTVILWIFAILWIYIYKFKKKEFMKYLEEKNNEILEMQKK
jgi:membrane-associated protein